MNTAPARSANMRAIRSTGMKPELIVRRLVHAMGYRYRLHRNDLPGRPDLVFTPRRKLIFVHGCFWHFHGCKLSHVPKSNLTYWQPKLDRNKSRDAANLEKLRASGWDILVIWECETANHPVITDKIHSFLARPC